MARVKKKLTKQALGEEISKTVGAGREVRIETVDFSDPIRPRSCLEVDFPIIPINQIAVIEGNAGKPIYSMSKWWARRRSSVFRSMLLASVMKAPDDESKAAKAVWDAYYANHQKTGAFRHLKVVDPFMGGGTTLVEGSRLGMQVFGNDLNSVAWFVVKNELSATNVDELKRLLAHIESAVRPQITPYYTCEGPDGESGLWFKTTNGQETVLPPTFDIFSVPPDERSSYRYEGPEVIYSFWAKHGPCVRDDCRHRTPIISSSVIAVKTLSVDAWVDWACLTCKKPFDIERHHARMAPDADLFVSPDEKAYVVMDDAGTFICPHCTKTFDDRRAKVEGNSSLLGKSKSKKIELALLLHPEWLKGCAGNGADGRTLGGSVVDDAGATAQWNEQRGEHLRVLEARGALTGSVTCPATGATIATAGRSGTVPRDGHFTCQNDTCGKSQPLLDAVTHSGKPAPFAAYLVQAYSPKRAAAGHPYNGRFFTLPDVRQLNEAEAEWQRRKETDLKDYWPRTSMEVGAEIGKHDVHGHHYERWIYMFNARQALAHALLLKAIIDAPGYSESARELALGVFQQYLRNQNLFCFWNSTADKMEPFYSDNHFHPKNTGIENSVFGTFGRGNWLSCADKIIDGLLWAANPWEIVSREHLARVAPSLAEELDGKGHKVFTGDAVIPTSQLRCGSATDLAPLAAASVDIVITDPPFGDLIQYSELADFFHVWLRLALKERHKQEFGPESTAKSLEGVSNHARNEDPDGFYRKILTEAWRECHRILKPSGLLAFTFHHSEDEPWVDVLTSLFDAGFVLEATFPIRGDESKGDGEFGSKKVEYDIIHVCRKRMAEPKPISWARLRRQIIDDVRRIETLLSQHQTAGLPDADLKVIRRGKALEYFSRHYGNVYVEQGRAFSIQEALVGINLLLDDSGSTSDREAPPANAEPYTRQFFRIFYETSQIPRDQMQKFLRGTGIAPSDFTERGWCKEESKHYNLTEPLDLARNWKGTSRKGMARDFDQTMFLVGACFEGSEIRVADTLESPHFAPHPATSDMLDWLARHGGTTDIKHAAQRARTIYRSWLSKNKAKLEEQLKLFDLGGGEG